MDEQQGTTPEAPIVPEWATIVPTCDVCHRQRDPFAHREDINDYTPIQLVTGAPLGWYSGDDGEICGSCLLDMIVRANG